MATDNSAEGCAIQCEGAMAGSGAREAGADLARNRNPVVLKACETQRPEPIEKNSSEVQQAVVAILQNDQWIWLQGSYTQATVQQAVRRFACLISLLCNGNSRSRVVETRAKVLISALLCACSSTHSEPADQVHRLARRLARSFADLSINSASASLPGVLVQRYTALVLALLEQGDGSAVLLPRQA